ncbi:Spo0E like sporulation regulatory protein [Candidatus Desulfosporosinus infrequens]|uniref:Spo0E like sporulation regulatory protein n=1 Tax=Candidatus Desulfosporosinus infrequens TaxID=2043169 RepID=A0A2U3LC91_9FIRM|nr:Spo0E like sporulation regulatory protein [Candidatus Desulfosporosinus infrequens]
MNSMLILYLIENLREKLNSLAQNKPLIDPEVIHLSQLLDSFLNLYHNAQSRLS